MIRYRLTHESDDTTLDSTWYAGHLLNKNLTDIRRAVREIQKSLNEDNYIGNDLRGDLIVAVHQALTHSQELNRLKADFESESNQ